MVFSVSKPLLTLTVASLSSTIAVIVIRSPPLKNFRRRTGEIKQMARTIALKEFEVVRVKAKSDNCCQKELIED